MFAVTVTFEIAIDQMQAFLPLMRENATASLRDEPGCQQFDICTDPARPGEVFLYELYTDAAAFETHKIMPHYESFNDAIIDMVTGKSVRTYSEVAQ